MGLVDKKKVLCLSFVKFPWNTHITPCPYPNNIRLSFAQRFLQNFDIIRQEEVKRRAIPAKLQNATVTTWAQLKHFLQQPKCIKDPLPS